jgi:16S rRNA (guanine966-N2)-methyltransferase
MAVRIYGNREIKTLPGEATRPTASRVREAVFNIWQGRVAGCRWLDLCAGSGSMGAEALCRGAAEVVGIESVAAACQVVSHNWQKVAKPEQRFQIVRGDVTRLSKFLAEGQLFDCVYFDPPYAGGLYGQVLSQLVPYVNLGGEVAVEYSEAKWQPSSLGTAWSVVKEKRYGNCHLVFLTRA